MRALLPAGLAMIVCLAVGACGDEQGVAPPKPGAGRDSGLGVKRFAELDSVFVAAVALDAYQDRRGFSSAKFRADAKPLLEACDALAEDDSLMRAMRNGCPLIAEFVERGTTVRTCDSSGACLRSMRSYRRLVRRLRAVSRRSDRAVAAEPKLAPECRQAMTTPSQAYAVFDAYDSAMLLMQRALRSGSSAAFGSAQGRLAVAGKASKTLSSNRTRAERFRSDCG
ncbi:MAG: hypothetical protein QOD83_2773 [Solirubrobacteraceae bacterium]|jgi:hypothetical protein|nr:hypothetical protein [Solirubrobacteraceae bacterium]